MLRKIFILLSLFWLVGCASDFVFIDVERSTLYCGQTVASLFDNFGVPSKQHLDYWGIREYHYKHQRFLKKGVEDYIFYCDLVVYTDDGLVIDWEYRGNQCAVEVKEPDWFLIPNEL